MPCLPECPATPELAVQPPNGKDILSSLALAADGHYAGRVEFGLTRRDETMLRALRSLQASPVTVAGLPTSSSIQWVEARLNANVRSLRWQAGRHVRHAVLRSVDLATR